MGEAKKATQHYRHGLRIAPGTVPAKNNLAWVLATHPDDAVRDGKEALRLAREAVAAAGGRDVTMLGTLAAAQAEQGLFDIAVRTVSQALILARDTGQQTRAVQLERRLELYRQGEPYRDRSLEDKSRQAAPSPSRIRHAG